MVRGVEDWAVSPKRQECLEKKKKQVKDVKPNTAVANVKQSG